MLINLSNIISKYNLNIRGIVHAGAHYGQEYDDYKKNGIRAVVFIEPCKAQFEVLESKFKGIAGISLFKCALGTEAGKANMNVETGNQGQSNSLLKPKEHTKQYPDIVFNGYETVDIKRLDQLPIDHSKYNLLMMDVQGYEKYVLGGVGEKLKHIDIVYTEVNNQELYEGCTMINELDEMLVDFDRVETHWVGNSGWGDAVYLRKMNIVSVPETFRQPCRKLYPEDNIMFEEWFETVFKRGAQNDKRIYLPVLWTSYYINHGYGKDAAAIKELQKFIDSLDRTKKYFTIVQYDDGILNNIKGLDIKVFAMSGKRIDYPLPLICKPHNFGLTHLYRKDFLFANFVGRITHPIRQKMMHYFNGNTFPGYYVSTSPVSLKDYCKILHGSTFTICPRGYGQTSFRIMEAMQYGSIPVYISDHYILPHNLDFEKYGVLIDPKDIGRIDEILKEIPTDQVKAKQKAIDDLFPIYFSYEGNRKLILNEIG